MSTRSAPSRRAPLILVVEDDPDIRDALYDALTDWSYLVRTADHGAQALEILGRGLRPDLVLLDLTMPVMDGVELRRRMLADPELAFIPTIVVTARIDAPVDLLRAHAVLRKPLDPEVLEAAVRRICDRDDELLAATAG
jgi:CheY-like chemotaxis protein